MKTAERGISMEDRKENAQATAAPGPEAKIIIEEPEKKEPEAAKKEAAEKESASVKSEAGTEKAEAENAEPAVEKEEPAEAEKTESAPEKKEPAEAEKTGSEAEKPEAEAVKAEAEKAGSEPEKKEPEAEAAGTESEKKEPEEKEPARKKKDPGPEPAARLKYLLTLRRAWLVPLLTIIGAILGWAIYLAVTALTVSVPYKQVSKLYIDFAWNDHETTYDYYNGATWTDLLTAHPEILTPIAHRLQMPEEEAAALVQRDVKAEILSDIRLLTVTVRDGNRDTAERLTEAVDYGLETFGETAKEFEKISFLSKTVPTLEVVDDRTENAVLLGAFLGLLLGLGIMLLKSAMEEGFYVPEELERATGIPALGMTAKEGSKLPDLFAAERREAIRTACWKHLYANEEGKITEAGDIALVSLDGAEHAEKVLSALEAAGDVNPSEDAELWPRFYPASAADPDDLRSFDGIFLVVPYGKQLRSRTEHQISVLRQQELPVDGVLLSDADGIFIKKYYRL